MTYPLCIIFITLGDDIRDQYILAVFEGYVLETLNDAQSGWKS